MSYEIQEIVKMSEGADIIAKDWLHLKRGERCLIVTTTTHIEEAHLMKQRFELCARSVDLMVMEEKGKKVSEFFDEKETIFDDYNVIVGAADYSIVTTKAAKRAIGRGSKFLSLPLSTNNGKSMLGFEFIKMDTKKSKMIANVIKRYIDSGQVVHVTTKLGTDLRFYKRNRYAGFFNGDVKAGRGFSSASIEIYVAIEETETTGTLILDGSLGYIGKVEKPFRIEIRNGQITEIEQTPDGKRLKEYLESFEDERMYIAAELGIVLNYLSKCEGNCYIEDESSYGTFHIGFGRNVALGGVQEACSHFDLVTFEPDIFVDNRKIIEEGRVIIPEPQVY